MKSTVRDTNFELLRIIAMLLIVTSHFSTHGGFEFDTNVISINRLFTQFTVLGNIGTNIFVLISGFFLISCVQMKVYKIIKLWAEIFFYSLTILVIFIIFDRTIIDSEIILKSIFPLTFEHWWFATAYMILFIFSPYINRLLNSLEKKDYKKLLFIMFLVWCVISTFTGQNMQSGEVGWFIFLYSMGGYIKLYQNDFDIDKRRCFFLAAIIWLMTCISVVFLDLIGMKWAIVGKHAAFLFGKRRMPSFFIAIFLFLGFSNLKIKYHKIINKMASATFGVYLIHTNVIIKSLLWKKVFHNTDFADSVILIPYACFAICTVYVVSTLIDLIRIKYIEKIYMKLFKYK